MFYSIRSERLLMEELDYNLLFRWFVGLNADDKVWDVTVFAKKPRPFAGDRRGQGVSVEHGRAGADQGPDLGRAFHRRWHLAGSVGGREKSFESAKYIGSLLSPAPPTIWCACET
jgi:IS5 family transposase